MTTQRAMGRNLLWNWSGVIGSMLAGFLMAPFLVHHLGDTRYGLWILMASLTSYFGLLDLGTRGSVARHIVFYRSKGDHEGVNAILNTALVMLIAATVLGLASTFSLEWLFFRLFDVPADDQRSTRLALLLVGVNFALSLVLSVFDALLWATQRFDFLNFIDLVALLVRSALILFFVGRGDGLVALAWITLLSTVASTSAKAVVGFWMDPTLRLRTRYIQRQAASCLLGYGSWNFIRYLLTVVNQQIGPLLIGVFLGVGLVTPYAVTSRLVGYGAALLGAVCGPTTARATALHAQDRRKEQRQMFLVGNKLALAGSLFFLILYVFLGAPLLSLWMGPEFQTASELLIIIALGAVLPMSQGVTTSIILGKGRPRILTLTDLLDNVAAVALAIVLLGPFGVPGMAVALAATGFFTRGVLTIWLGCRLLAVSPSEYVRQALVPSILSAAPAAVAIGFLTWWRIPSDWFLLLAYGAIGVACFLPAILALLKSGVPRPNAAPEMDGSGAESPEDGMPDLVGSRSGYATVPAEPVCRIPLAANVLSTPGQI